MRVPAVILSLLLGATPALADYPNHLPANDLPTKQAPKAELKKPAPKTTVTPEPAPPMDPSAGSGGNAAPVAGGPGNGNET